jgi:hypothetical protein
MQGTIGEERMEGVWGVLGGGVLLMSSPHTATHKALHMLCSILLHTMCTTKLQSIAHRTSQLSCVGSKHPA